MTNTLQHLLQLTVCAYNDPADPPWARHRTWPLADALDTVPDDLWAVRTHSNGLHEPDGLIAAWDPDARRHALNWENIHQTSCTITGISPARWTALLNSAAIADGLTTNHIRALIAEADLSPAVHAELQQLLDQATRPTLTQHADGTWQATTAAGTIANYIEDLTHARNTLQKTIDHTANAFYMRLDTLAHPRLAILNTYGNTWQTDEITTQHYNRRPTGNRYPETPPTNREGNPQRSAGAPARPRHEHTG